MKNKYNKEIKRKNETAQRKKCAKIIIIIRRK